MEEIKELVRLARGSRKNHKEIMAITNEVRLHSERDKNLARIVLDTIFPSEPVNLREYRINNITFVTKPYFDKVLGVIEKIRNIPEFHVQFPDETFRRYCAGVMDRVFDRYLRIMLVDPNAYLFVRPDYEEVFLSEYVKYDSDDLIIIEESKYTNERHEQVVVYKVFSTEGIHYLTVKGNKAEIVQVYEGDATKFMIKLGTRLADTSGTYYESLIQGVVDMWRMAFITFSDLAIGQKQHVFPEKYRYVTNGCHECGGVGKFTYMDDLDGEVVSICKACKGVGTPATGMMSETQVNIGAANSILETLKIPNPPVGYIEKNLEPIEMINSLYQQYIRGGLAAVSMEFLMDIGMNQSGVAKEIDRAEFNGFLGNAAKAIAGLLDKIYYAYWLEWPMAGENYDRVKPEVSMPKTYDAYYMRSTFEDLRAARDADVNPLMIVQTEMKIAEELLSGLDLKRALWSYQIDPMAGYTLDQKEQIYAQGNVSRIDYFVSVNINKLLLETTGDGYFDNRTNVSKVRELVYEKATGYLSQIP